ncbi:MAG: hypothetical protein HRU01_22320 [Myxococcales bacterium]|nr:hypothetical protein [Myxococcales bacterium]
MSPTRSARGLAAACFFLFVAFAPLSLAGDGSLPLSGTAEGGRIKLTVDGVRVALRTQPGAPAASELERLAQALRATPSLEGLDVAARNGRLTVNAVVMSVVVSDPGFAPGECGDGRLAFGERCDDANALSGDGCSASCEIEFDWQLYGTSAGDGRVALEVHGIEVAVSPSAGLPGRAVLVALAVELATEPSLNALGVHALVLGDRLVLNEPIGFVAVSDSGLRSAGKLARGRNAPSP